MMSFVSSAEFGLNPSIDMDLRPLLPFVAPAIRHFLVAGGVFELSQADEVSNQLAAVLITLVGIGWSFHNAHKKKDKSA